MNKKMGRPTIKGEALTNAEKKRRYNAKLAIRSKVAEDSGFGVYSLLISRGQLLSLLKFWRIDDFGFNIKMGIDTEVKTRKITSEDLSEVVYYALNAYLDGVKDRLIGEGVPAHIVAMCEDSNRHPIDCEKLSKIETTTQQLFKEWEKSQEKQENKGNQ